MGVVLISTGGTIASVTNPTTNAVTATLSPRELLATVPGLDQFQPITVKEISNINGWNVTLSTMLAVANHIEDAFAQTDIDGAVVTHGTDTIEEIAFFCDITIDSAKPIVFVGAMRSDDQFGADGPRNLLNAFRLVCQQELQGYGSLVTLNDEVHSARWVVKTNSSNTAAFASPLRGPIGLVSSDEMRILAGPSQRYSVPLPDSFEKVVPIIKTFTGMREGLVRAIIEETHAGGLVLEGTGLGNVPGAIVSDIEWALGEGILVAIATRVHAGGTHAVYGGPGGLATLKALGVVEAKDLTAAKARLLMLLILERHAKERGSTPSEFETAIEALCGPRSVF